MAEIEEARTTEKPQPWYWLNNVNALLAFRRCFAAKTTSHVTRALPVFTSVQVTGFPPFVRTSALRIFAEAFVHVY